MIFFISCKSKPSYTGVGFNVPSQGQSFGLGDDIKVELDLPEGTALTSADYFIDGKPAASSTDAKAVNLKTEGLAVGYKVITAVVDREGVKDTATINVVLNSGKAPEEYTYKILHVYPHDTTSYTEGLAYHNGKFLESTGEKGKSTLRWIEPSTGKTLKRHDLDTMYYGEGSALVGDKIIMLTYTTNLGFVFDASSFKQLGTFNYSTKRDGWGLCFDGKQLISTDGSNRLYFMDKNTYQDEHVIDVYDNKGAVQLLNELEYINGKLYANLFTKNDIVVIDPHTGIVEKRIDLSGLMPKGYYKDDYSAANNVLNGIAWDEKGGRLFVTGKKWPKMFEIELVPRK